MPTPTTICLVRHGETDWNLHGFTQGSTDIPLNDTGRRQAAETARALAADRWDLLVASPLVRAMETAEIIGRCLDLPDIESEPGLVERAYGVAEGMDSAERKRRFPDKVIPDAESWDSVHERSMRALERLANDHAGKRIVAVSHGGAILSLLSQLSGGLYSHRTVTLENASMSVVEYAGRWSVRWCNRSADAVRLSVS